MHPRQEPRRPNCRSSSTREQHQRRRTAVRAVVSVVDEVSLGQQRLDLLRLQPLTRLDRRLAGHHVQDRSRRSRRVTFWPDASSSSTTCRRISAGSAFRQASSDSHVSATVLPLNGPAPRARARRDIGLVDQQADFPRRQFDRHRDQEPLDLDRLRQNPAPAAART